MDFGGSSEPSIIVSQISVLAGSALQCVLAQEFAMLLYDTWLKYRFILRHNRGEVVCQPGFHQLEHALKAKT